MGLRHSRDVGSQAPPLSLVYVEKYQGAWGQGYTNAPWFSRLGTSAALLLVIFIC